MTPPPMPAPRSRGLLGAFFLLLGGVFIGSTCSTCATMRANQEGPFAPDGPRVGVVEVLGPIMESREVVEHLARFTGDDDIEAVVLRVDSPGGAVGPSQEIFEAVRRTDSVKPVVASMGSVAASGGFWIALAAREIYANPGTITGSIGVIVQTPNLSRIAELLRFDLTTYKSGPHKDLGSPFRAPSPGDEAIFQALVDDVYAQFVELTAERRGLSLDEVKVLADGRVVTGRDAREAGLVDAMGGLETAARRAVALARGTATSSTTEELPEGEVPVLVYPPDPVPPLLDILTGSLSSAIANGVSAAVDRSARALSQPSVEVR